MTDAPVCNLDAESAVLSAVMLDPTGNVLDEVRPMLDTGEPFYSTANQLIYRAVVSLDADGKTFDPVAVMQRLHDEKRDHQAGGSPYLAQIIEGTPTAGDPREHARIVRDLWRRRQVIALAVSTAARARHDVGTSADEVQLFMEDFEAAAGDLAHTHHDSTLEPIKDVLMRVGDSITAIQNGTATPGIETGIRLLDDRLGGLRDGDLNYIAARPGMGKTAYALDMARREAQDGYAVPFFSLEMPADQLAMRIIATDAKLDLNKLRRARLSRTEWNRYAESMQRIAKLPIFIDDTAAITPLEIRARLKRLAREVARGQHPAATKGRLGSAIIDYVQLVHPVRSTGSREQDVASISRDLKLAAKLLRLPLVALCQLNRKLESRVDKRPQLGDLRESGALEQDADTVLFLFRPGYYDAKDPSLQGWAEIIIGKQRNGPTGVVRVGFDAKCARFDNLAWSDEATEEEGPDEYEGDFEER